MKDPELRAFWDWFEHVPDNVADSVINKLDSFVGYSLIRNIVGQQTSGIDVAEVMLAGDILLAPLAGGLIGERNAATLGALVADRDLERDAAPGRVAGTTAAAVLRGDRRVPRRRGSPGGAG